jgi:hypothetical protein
VIVLFKKYGTAVAIAATAAGLMCATPARADDAPPQLLLDEQSKAVKAVDVAVSLRTCVDLPGGAEKGTDGWVFDQPIHAPVGPVTVIGFVDDSTGALKPVVLRVDGDGLWLVPIVDGQAGAPVPAPDGMAGGLLGGGTGGAWLRTPAGWRVVYGVDTAQSGTADTATFGLAAVCLPPPSTGGVAGTPTAAGTGTPTHPASPSAAVAEPTLPVTGGRTAIIAGVGAVLVLLGGAALALTARRRRERVRFDA